MQKDLIAGYYQLLIAIFCGLNATEAKLMYEYGPSHPICKRFLKKKLQKQDTELSREDRAQIISCMRKEGYTWESIAEAMDCEAATAKAWLGETEKRKTA